MIEIRPNYREVMAYQIYSAVGFLVAPFSVWALARGQYLLAVPPLATAALSIVNALHFRRYGRFYVPPCILSLFYIADIVVVIRELGAVGAYWSFPILLALYWKHPRRLAVPLATLCFVAVCGTAYLTLPPETAVRIGATLLTTAVFFNIAVSNLEQQYDELKKLTVTDHLTGAFNRRYMDSKLDELIERKKRGRGEAALVALDVDHFKRINDLFGHSTGDRILVRIVELIRSRVRVLDSVCRAGGEEFIIILPDTTEAQARAVGDELRATIGSSPMLKESRVTVSCGVSGLRNGDTRDRWLRRCDQALYVAKNNGRNAVAVFEEGAADLAGA
ncbi:GGDEF domain-containing protein [Gilvimarinus sp. F26214L]|uniref:GGDEF domain-containing protein n=1 Tax=Gilvimarinus sp. DZF01 TaxID=3461371 RepID=UPI0040459A57